MKYWYFLAAAVFAIVVVVMFQVRPDMRVQPEFLDKTQEAHTVAVEDSSYRQATNHMDPAPYSTEPVVGHETPFQVNQYRAFVV